MRFHLSIMFGVAALALPAGAQSQQSQPSNARAAQPAGTAPDEAVAGPAAKPAQTPPAASDQTTATTPANAQASAGQVKAAGTADVKSGISVYDEKGGLVGKIESVNAKGAVVNTGTARASIPIASFAKNDKGLLLSMTKAEIEAAAKKKSPK